ANDVERLRWILREQREHFLPLKVIRDRLAREGDAVLADNGSPVRSEEPAMAMTGGGHRPVSMAHQPAVPSSLPSSGGPADPPVCPAAAASGRPSPLPATSTPSPAAMASSADRQSTPARTSPPAAFPGSLAPAVPAPAAPIPAAPTPIPAAPTPIPAVPGPGASAVPAPPTAAAASPTPSPAGPVPPPPTGAPVPPQAPVPPAAAVPAAAVSAPNPGPGPTAPTGPASTRPVPAATTTTADLASGASLTVEELCSASGLAETVIASLEGFGLIEPMAVAGTLYYDEEALAVAKLVADFGRYGIEPRHLRMYRNAVDREMGLIEQIVTPLLRQRNPEARQRAVEAATELSKLGQGLRASLLRREVRRQVGG
ncbi:MAG TPA: hypothetical protein VHW47_08195, partial [Acidimicrobiales bacterium]|nr:hypothetical protein [Acidimicrobiales bacterium]